MPQLSLYVDQATLLKVRSAARRSHTSVSRWVRSRIKNSVESSWPEEYFELEGSIADDSFKRPAQKDLATDTSRDNL